MVDQPTGTKPPIELKLSFPATKFPEMAHLPLEEQIAILEKCVDADSVKKVSRQSLFLVRNAWIILLVGAIMGFAWSRFTPNSWAPIYIMQGMMLFVLVGFPLSFVAYHLRTSRELRRLVRQRLHERD